MSVTILRRTVLVVELAVCLAVTAVVAGVLTWFGLFFVYDLQAAWAEFFDDHQQVAWAGLFVSLAVLLRSVVVMHRRPRLALVLLGSAVGLTLGVSAFALTVTTGQR